MKTYAATLSDLKLFSDLAAQLDDVKSRLPKDSPVRCESQVLVDHGHAAVERLLGTDAHLIYGQPEDQS